MAPAGGGELHRGDGPPSRKHDEPPTRDAGAGQRVGVSDLVYRQVKDWGRRGKGKRLRIHIGECAARQETAT